jgi:hypothetical protein
MSGISLPQESKSQPMEINWSAIRCLLLALSLSTPARAGLVLTFDEAVPGTIADVNAIGTGFTHRLPGSGGSLGDNDPSLQLQASQGRLLMYSTQTDINGGVNLGYLEAPGTFLPGVGTSDIRVVSVFRDVFVPNGSDQLELYAGTSASSVLRAGVHDGYQFIFTENYGAGDYSPFATGAFAFSPGDSLMLMLSRTNGLWQLSWENLTTNATGSSPWYSLAWLNSSPDLYVGILASNPRSANSFLATVDYFSVSVVPEIDPTTGGSALSLVAGVLAMIEQRRRRAMLST